MGRQQKEEVFLGTICEARWENGGKYARISPIADIAPGQPVAEMRFPSHMDRIVETALSETHVHTGARWYCS